MSAPSGEDRRQDYDDGYAAFHDLLIPAAETARTVSWLAEAHLGGHPSLELGVGSGRIAIPLAHRTGEVVGVDASPAMLALLRRRLEHNPAPVTPVFGDMRGFPAERRYGLVLCLLGTLSTVLDVPGQSAVIETCARAALPGATVVIEAHNVARVLAAHDGARQVQWTTDYPEPRAVLRSRSTLDHATRIWQLEHRWQGPDGSSTASETTRLTTPEEIDRYASAAGLIACERLGAWDGTPFRGHEPMVICVLRHPPA